VNAAVDDVTAGRVQGQLLHRVLEEIGISDDQLWRRYVELGGAVDEAGVTAYVHGCVVLPVFQRDLLAAAANSYIDDRFHRLAPTTAELTGHPSPPDPTGQNQ